MRYKKIKIFDKKRITVRSLLKSDLKHPKKFQDFINSFIKEDAQILLNKRVVLKEEINYLEGRLKGIERHRCVHLVAEYNKLVVGGAGIDSGIGREAHVGDFGITIKKGYRRIGLGSFISNEIIKLAKKELRSSPKIIKLRVYSTNKPAINLYKKLGFKKVARVPDQMQYKGRLIDEIVMLLYLSKKEKKR